MSTPQLRRMGPSKLKRQGFTESIRRAAATKSPVRHLQNFVPNPLNRLRARDRKAAADDSGSFADRGHDVGAIRAGHQ
jgi:hypothetical protein